MRKMKTQEKIYKKLKNLQKNKDNLKDIFFGSDLQRLITDHTFKSQIDILKEIIKGDLKDLKKKFGNYQKSKKFKWDVGILDDENK